MNRNNGEAYAIMTVIFVIMTVIFVLCLMFYFGSFMHGRAFEKSRIETEAVKIGVAEYIPDESGKPKWQYIIQK